MVKRIAWLCSTLIILLILSLQVQAQGYLHTEGKQIVNAQGEEVLLRGIGLGGWMLQEPYMLKLSDVVANQQEFRAKVEQLIGEERTQHFYDKWYRYGMQKSDVDSLATWGFNSIRLPIHYKLFTLPVDEEPVKGENIWRERGFSMTDSLLKWAEENQMYIILDLHAAPGGQGHDLPIADRDSTEKSLWQSKAKQQKTVALWKKLAQRYKNEKSIGGYDLINEPNWSFENPDDREDYGCEDKGNAPIKRLYKDITSTIRSVDQNHIIFIEGNCWANNFNGLLPPWDDNMVISFHKYWNENNQASIQGFLDIRDEYNVPLWLGESGENNNEWYRDATQLMERNNIGWAWWPLKKIGDSNPFKVNMPDGFRDIIQYWKGEAPKPTEEEAYQALLELSENFRTENLVVQYDVIDALLNHDK